MGAVAERLGAIASRLAQIMSCDIVLSDNVLYQGSLDLIEESDYRRISNVVVRSLERWEENGLTDAYPRLRECYEANRRGGA